MSKDDIALALNHVDEGNRTTDIYIAKDWKIVDDVQRKVISQFRRTEMKVIKKTKLANNTEIKAA
jgi:hypothetical protein